jgi:hypothetical protein
VLKDLASPRNAIAAGGLVLMLGFVWLSLDNPIMGIASVVLFVGIVTLIALGYERTINLMMLAAMFTAPANSLRPTASAGFVTFSDLFFVMGIGLLIPKLIKGRANFPTPYALGALMMFSAGLVASWFANDVAISTNVLFRLVAASIFLPVAFILWNPSAKMIDAMAIVYVLGQIMSVIGALANGKDAESGRYMGFTVHFNFFALCSLQAICFGFFLLHRLRPSLRPYVWAAMAICTFGVLLSGSRAGLGALVVIAVMYPFWEKSGAKLILLICGFLMVIVMFPVLAQIGGEGVSPEQDRLGPRKLLQLPARLALPGELECLRQQAVVRGRIRACPRCAKHLLASPLQRRPDRLRGLHDDDVVDHQAAVQSRGADAPPGLGRIRLSAAGRAHRKPVGSDGLGGPVDGLLGNVVAKESSPRGLRRH